MMRRQRRWLQSQTLKRSSKVEGLHPKKKSRSSKNFNMKTSENSKLSTQKSQNKNSKPSTSHDKFASKFNRNYKRGNLVESESDKSSCSENEDIVRKVVKGSLRALSDYESDNNCVTKARNSLKNSSNYNNRTITKKYSVNVTAKDSSFVRNGTLNEDSLGSKDELFLRPSKRGGMKALSDYETGDSNDRNVEPQFNCKRINATSSNLASYSQIKDNTNSRSESDYLWSRTISMYNKRALSTPSSTSDSSDANMVISLKKYPKRKKISTRSEGKESENTNINRKNKTKQTGTDRSTGCSNTTNIETITRNNQKICIELEISNEPACDDYAATRYLIQSANQFSKENHLPGTSNNDQLNRKSNSETSKNTTYPLKRHNFKRRKSLLIRPGLSNNESSTDEESVVPHPKRRHQTMSSTPQKYSIASDSKNASSPLQRYNTAGDSVSNNMSHHLQRYKTASDNDSNHSSQNLKKYKTASDNSSNRSSQHLQRYNTGSDSDSNNMSSPPQRDNTASDDDSNHSSQHLQRYNTSINNDSNHSTRHLQRYNTASDNDSNNMSHNLQRYKTASDNNSNHSSQDLKKYKTASDNSSNRSSQHLQRYNTGSDSDSNNMSSPLQRDNTASDYDSNHSSQHLQRYNTSINNDSNYSSQHLQRYSTASDNDSNHSSQHLQRYNTVNDNESNHSSQDLKKYKTASDNDSNHSSQHFQSYNTGSDSDSNSMSSPLQRDNTASDNDSNHSTRHLQRYNTASDNDSDNMSSPLQRYNTASDNDSNHSSQHLQRYNTASDNDSNHSSQHLQRDNTASDNDSNTASRPFQRYNTASDSDNSHMSQHLQRYETDSYSNNMSLTLDINYTANDNDRNRTSHLQIDSTASDSNSASSSLQRHNTDSDSNNMSQTLKRCNTFSNSNDSFFGLNINIQRTNLRNRPWISENESSSDEESYIFQPKRRHRRISSPLQRYNTTSDSDSNDSFIISYRRARGSIIRIQDSDCSSDEAVPDVIDNSLTDQAIVSTDQTITSNIKCGSSSDSDTDSEKCPICFNHFVDREVATPESCSHSFCTMCIQEWAKNNNTCPVDRKLFNKILVYSSFGGPVIREIPIETPVVNSSFWVQALDLIEEVVNNESDFVFIESDDFEEEERCLVCNQSNNLEIAILCDNCNGAYHMRCLNPPLRYVPAGNWYCPTCFHS